MKPKIIEIDNIANVIIEGYWPNSIMNGAVLNVGGVCRTVMCGAHCGCSSVIMEISKYEEASIRSKQVKRPQG